MKKQLIKNLSDQQIIQWLNTTKQQTFRMQQIRQWLYKNYVDDFSQMKNIPKTLQTALNKQFQPFALSTLKNSIAKDQTQKFLLQLHDKQTIETVLIQAPTRNTVCISTQVGCPVRCTFCASGKQGLIRNLEPAEIIDQVIYASKQCQNRITNIVVMGMGEPLLNLDNLITALNTICQPERLALGARHITISTSGIVPAIYKLADLKRQWNLAFSLHAVIDQERAKLIPQTHRYPLQEIIQACEYYLKQTTRKVTIEYTLIANHNDSQNEMKQVANIAKQIHAKVNLIPYNPVTTNYKQPNKKAIEQFLNGLQNRGVQATIRREKGADIQAACGQLRQNNQIQ